MNRKIIRIILMSILAAVFAVSVGMMIVQQIQYREAIADTEEALRLVGLLTDTETRRPEPTVTEKPPEGTGSPAAEEPPEEGPPAEELPEEALELAGLNLEALRAINADVVGWIAIPGTIVSYPLMQGTNNQYYLTHNWKKEYSGSGSVYLEANASRDLTDFHTIIYGHRMRNGTMFGSIGHYSEAAYWREHPSVYIILDDVIYRYNIFSAQKVGVDGIVYRLDLESSHLEEEFLKYCREYSLINTGLTPGKDDRIVTLSTCTSNLSETQRWVIHGVQVQAYRRTNS